MVLFKAIIAKPNTITVAEIAVKMTLGPYFSVIDDICPAKTPAKNDAIVQKPISNDANFTGDNLLTIESPTGDKQSSAIV